MVSIGAPAQTSAAEYCFDKKNHKGTCSVPDVCAWSGARYSDPMSSSPGDTRLLTNTVTSLVCVWSVGAHAFFTFTGARAQNVLVALRVPVGSTLSMVLYSVLISN